MSADLLRRLEVNLRVSEGADESGPRLFELQPRLWASKLSQPTALSKPFAYTLYSGDTKQLLSPTPGYDSVKPYWLAFSFDAPAAKPLYFYINDKLYEFEVGPDRTSDLVIMPVTTVPIAGSPPYTYPGYWFRNFNAGVTITVRGILLFTGVQDT